MEDNKNLVTEEVTENVEQTTEETPKTYTEAEFNDAVNSKVKEVMGSKIARKEAKIRKEYDRKYGDLVDTLKAGTGKETVEEINDAFKGFYQKKGIDIPQRPNYSNQDIEVLARADADDIIRGGFDEVIEEADRLKELGVENMTAREKAVFLQLTKHIKDTETSREMAKIGVSEDVYNSDEFKNFAKLFKDDTPISVIYDNYNKTQPKKEIKTMGSMKNNNSVDNGVKDYYSPEEARRFSQKEINENPALFAAIERSMQKWKK
jgi:hypothetical protein